MNNAKAEKMMSWQQMSKLGAQKRRLSHRAQTFNGEL